MRRRLLRGLFLVLGGLAVPLVAQADNRFGTNDVRTLFVIGKNIDRNEVQYGIHLDKDCAPVGQEPLYAYWRQFERGSDVTEDLNLLDRTVYGIAGQWVTERAPEGGKVLMKIKAAGDRGIAIVVKKVDGKCVGDAISTVAGQRSHLSRVFVHVAGILSVDWVEIRGTDASTNKPVVERVAH